MASRRVRRQIPPEIAESPEIKAAVAALPSNYSFEVQKTIWRVREASAKCVALQFPEGLLLYANAIADMICRFCEPARVVVLADVTYGACCVDDLTAKSLGADFLVHYGHSCLVPSRVTQLPSLYVFVEIGFDVDHLVACIQAEFALSDRLEGGGGAPAVVVQEGGKRCNIALAGTVQFAGGVSRAAALLREKDASLEVRVPQELPLSAGEVLGCTSPRLEGSTEAFVFVADGRFHLESLMIRNPTVAAFRYDPYSKVLTRERYDSPRMYSNRREAIARAKTAQRFGVVLGTLGRQGSPAILRRVREALAEAQRPHFVLLVSELSIEKLKVFEGSVDCWIQIACPRLSIDWGHAFRQPLLSPYEAFVALEGVEDDWEKQGHYPMDFYSRNGGAWTNYHMDAAPTTLTSTYGAATGSQYVRLHLPALARDAADGLTCIILVHGGFWKSKYSLDNAAIDSLAPWLLKRHCAAVEVEYRRLPDDDGAGWPGTPEDVAAAVEHVLVRQRSGARGWRRIDPMRLVLVGHSAGAHAVLHVAHRASTAPALAVLIAPVADLVEAHRRRLSDDGDAVERFMGDNNNNSNNNNNNNNNKAAPAEYERASYRALLPLRSPTLVVSGTRDADIPPDMTEAFYRDAHQHQAAGKPVALQVLDGADHYTVVATAHHWPAIWDRISTFLDSGNLEDDFGDSPQEPSQVAASHS